MRDAMRHPLAAVALISTAGALLSLLVGSLPLSGHELTHLALLLPVAICLTVAATAIVAPRLARAPIRVRLVGIACFAVGVALANLLALSWLMLVSGQDAVQIGILLIYSLSAASAVAIATAHESGAAIERLETAAARLAEGELSARAGDVGGGPELAALASNLDEMAARLESSIGRERAAEAQRRDLVTAVSHDLRTPLAGLRAMIEAIDDGVVRDEATVRRYVGEMRGAVDSLVLLIDDLFELVALDAGAIEAETERARLGDVVRAAVAACDARATEKGLALEVRLDGADSLMTSPRLSTVVQNLLQNAIRHTPADGTVSLEATAGSSGFELVVEDSGEGIDPASVERVFEPFWRGDSARSGEGAGLGLALAKRIVEALGGAIAVSSAPRRGSRFSISMP